MSREQVAIGIALIGIAWLAIGFLWGVVYMKYRDSKKERITAEDLIRINTERRETLKRRP